MTTPTSPQGALERAEAVATEIHELDSLISRKNKGRADRLYYEIVERDTLEVLGAFGTAYEADAFERQCSIERIAKIVAAAFTASASEARAECVKKLRERADHGRIWELTAYDVAADYLERALATPAQSETPPP